MAIINPQTGKPFDENVNPFTGQAVAPLSAQITQEDFASSFANQKQAPVTPEVAPTAPVQEDKTVSDLMRDSGFVPKNQALDDAYSAYGDIIKEDTAPVNEEEIRQKTMDRFQAEIDALNKVFAEKKQEEAIQGRGRLGSTRAIQARRGLLGSDFGASQTEETRRYNQRLQDAIDAEKAVKIQAILGKARQEAVDEISKKTEARRQGAKAYIEYLAGADKRKTERLQSTIADVVSNGVEADDQFFASLAEELGVTKEQAKAEYNRQNVKAQPELQKPITVSPGQSIFDPNTGKFIGRAPERPADSTKPITEKVGDSLLRYNPATDSYDVIFKDKQSEAPEEANRKSTQLNFVADTIENAFKFADAAGPSKWSEAIKQGVFGATDFTTLQSYADTIKTNLLSLASDPDIKKFFGPQMSDADVRLMTAGGTTLNPQLQRPEQFKEELTRVKDLINRMKSSLPQAGEQTTNTGYTPTEDEVQEYMKADPTATRDQAINILKQNPPKDFSQPLSMGKKGSYSVQSIADAIGQHESGGNYNARGKDGEIGKYQIMPNNYALWAQEAGISPTDYSPQAQEKIAQYKIGQYASQYNNDPVAVAIAWNAGQGRANEYIRTGQIPQLSGTSAGGASYNVGRYVQSVVNNLG